MKDWIEVASIDLDKEFPPDNMMIQHSYGDIRITFFKDDHYQGQVVIDNCGSVVMNDYT